MIITELTPLRLVAAKADWVVRREMPHFAAAATNPKLTELNSVERTDETRSVDTRSDEVR